MKYVDDILKSLIEDITQTIGNLKHNYKYGMAMVTDGEIKHEIIGYLNGLYDAGLIVLQERNTLYDYCIGKFDN